MEKLSGKTALVTGSTDGVGRLVVRKLGQAGARVLVHGRDAERGARVVADIKASGGSADFLAADLSALAEVRRLADEAQATVDRLDILINNAGIGTAGPHLTSSEGFELRFAVNYLAGFLLTLLLLPLIKNSAPARIVNVSSAGQQPIDFGDVMLTGGYSGTRAYSQSKLAQIMFTIDLGALLEDRRGGQTGGSRWGAQSIVFSGIDGRLLGDPIACLHGGRTNALRTPKTEVLPPRALWSGPRSPWSIQSPINGLVPFGHCLGQKTRGQEARER